MNIEPPFAPLPDLLVKNAALILIGNAQLAVMRNASAANRHAVSAAVVTARTVRKPCMGLAFAAMALALCTTAQLRGADEGKPAPAANANGAKADRRWVFPKVDFRDATFREAVEFLAAKSKTLDATGAGANIVITNADKISDVRITLTLNNVPLADLLRYVAALADCEVVKEEFAFVIGPKQAGKVPASGEDQEKGGANAPAAPVPAKPAAAALKKAGAIIFPKIDFRDATLSESVDYLRHKSKILDPENKGVNLILNKPAAAGDEARITLTLANIPLSEALRYVAALAGYEIVADDNALTLRPAAK